MRRALPYLALAAGLVVATAPAWRVLLVGTEPTVEDLLQLRCLPE